MAGEATPWVISNVQTEFTAQRHDPARTRAASERRAVKSAERELEAGGLN